jgi:hypothetical protein
LVSFVAVVSSVFSSACSTNLSFIHLDKNKDGVISWVDFEDAIEVKFLDQLTEVLKLLKNLYFVVL